MENVFVPDDDKLEKATNFKLDSQDILKHFWIYVAWMATGMAAGALEYAIKNYTE